MISSREEREQAKLILGEDFPRKIPLFLLSKGVFCLKNNTSNFIKKYHTINLGGCSVVNIKNHPKIGLFNMPYFTTNRKAGKLWQA